MSYNSYLSHHGIKGQKWGVENGPPYPLNDIVKAIAYRGGVMKDGSKVTNYSEKDIKKARKIINKNLKSLTNEEVQEYKSRLLLEKSMGEILGTDGGDKLKQKLKEKAIEAVGDSVKNTGTKLMGNVEMSVIDTIVSNSLGPDVAAMVTNGMSKYDLAKEKYNKKKAKAEQDLNERKQDLEEQKQKFDELKWPTNKDKTLAEANKLNAEADEIRSKIKGYTGDNDDSNDNTSSSKESSGTKYEKAEGDEIPRNFSTVDGRSPEPEYSSRTDLASIPAPKRTVRYESWNDEHLLPDNGGSKSSSKSSNKSSSKSSSTSIKPIKPKKAKYEKRKKVNGEWRYTYSKDYMDKHWKLSPENDTSVDKYLTKKHYNDKRGNVIALPGPTKK